MAEQTCERKVRAIERKVGEMRTRRSGGKLVGVCAGALLLARVDRLVFGCADPKAGACGSLYNIVSDERLNHRIEVQGGVLGDECAAALSEFFKTRRLEAEL